MSTNIDLSILIVSFNSSATIASCIRSAQVASSHLSSEILILDNASTDSTLEELSAAASSFDLLIESKENLGFARAINQLATWARGDSLLLLNPDAQINFDCISKQLNVLASPEIGAVGPTICSERGKRMAGAGWQPSITRLVAEIFLFPNLSRLTSRSGIYARRRLLDLENNLDVDWLAGTALAIRKSMWIGIGGFSEDYFLYCEDMDLGLKLKRQGLDLLLLTDASVQHIGGASQRDQSLAREFQLQVLRSYYSRISSGRNRIRPAIFSFLIDVYAFQRRWGSRGS